MKNNILLVALLSISVSSCVSSKNNNDESTTNLEKFAYANCLFQYFKSKGYDTKSIRNISGGLVETGNSPAEKYASIAQAIATMELEIPTKSDVEPKLNKCFHLEKNKELVKIIGLTSK